MTLRPEDFVVTWHAAPNAEKPATYSEVIQAMEQINERAMKAKPGSVIEITLRTPVAIVTAGGINEINPGTALVDVGQDPRFVPEKGGYMSRLTVAPTAEHMTAYVEDF